MFMKIEKKLKVEFPSLPNATEKKISLPEQTYADQLLNQPKVLPDNEFPSLPSQPKPTINLFSTAYSKPRLETKSLTEDDFPSLNNFNEYENIVYQQDLEQNPWTNQELREQKRNKKGKIVIRWGGKG